MSIVVCGKRNFFLFLHRRLLCTHALGGGAKTAILKIFEKEKEKKKEAQNVRCSIHIERL